MVIVKVPEVDRVVLVNQLSKHYFRFSRKKEIKFLI